MLEGMVFSYYALLYLWKWDHNKKFHFNYLQNDQHEEERGVPMVEEDVDDPSFYSGINCTCIHNLLRLAIC